MANVNPIHSVLFNKCPRCGKGNFFITNSSYSLKFDKMHSHCPVCNEHFVPEPGFYQGALYMSYAYYVAFMVIYFLLFNHFLSDYFNYFLVSIIPLFLLLTPIIYRLARRSWFTIFMKKAL